MLGGLGPESAAHPSVSGVLLWAGAWLGVGLGAIPWSPGWLWLFVISYKLLGLTECVLLGVLPPEDVHILGLGVCRAAALGSS